MNHICTASFEQHRREQMRLSSRIQVVEFDQMEMQHCQFPSAITPEMLQQFRNNKLEGMLMPRPIFSTSMAPPFTQKPTKRKLPAATSSSATESKLTPAYVEPVVIEPIDKVDLGLLAATDLQAAESNVDDIEDDPGEEEDEELAEPAVKLDRSRGLMLKCRYCGCINTEKQLNENKQLFDPHLKRHLPGSPDRKEPTGIGGRAGRCIFCYAKFPKASCLAAPEAEASGSVYHGTLGLEANKVTLKLRKKSLDDPDSSLHYRVLLRNTGLLTSILGKVSEKNLKDASPASQKSSI